MNLQETIRKKLKEETEKETEVSRIIKKTAKEYNCSAWDINNGYCEDFAENVMDKLGGYDDNNLFGLSGDMFFNQRDIDFAKENWSDIIETKYGVWSKYMLEYWGYPPNVDLYLIDDEINHTWLYFNGKHYDAEVPNGVKNWYDIPLIKRHLKKGNNINLQETIRKVLREELYSPAGEEYIPGRVVVHKSNPVWRDSIKEVGLFISVGDCYQQYVGGDVECVEDIFATDSLNKKDMFDSTYDDDIWLINTECAGVKWYKDKHFETGDYKHHIVTFENISPECIKLIYKGAGKSY